MNCRPRTAWAVKWRSWNALDGSRAFLLGRFGHNAEAPAHLAGYITTAFGTRAEARKWIKENYGYIAQRHDLQREPFGWKMPIPVKVKVKISEIRA